VSAAELAVRRHIKHLSLEGKSTYTIIRREQAISRLEKHLPVPLLEATPDMLYEWRASMTVKPASVACYLSHVKSFFAWAVTEGLVGENPMAGVPVPKMPNRFPRPIPEADLMAALDATTSKMWIRAGLVLAGWCGLRVGEIAGLRVENLRLHDTPPVVIVSAESAKGRKERVVELSPFVVREMFAYDLPLAGYAFTDAYGRPFTPWFMSRTLNEHLRGCGTKSRFHDLRHRFASQAYQATKDLRLVQELMGHSAPSTTAKYAAFSRAGAAALVAAIPVPGQLPPEPMREAS
jgi:integrase/recombinase XerC